MAVVSRSGVTHSFQEIQYNVAVCSVDVLHIHSSKSNILLAILMRAIKDSVKELFLSDGLNRSKN